jgi:hypothetical protein
LSTRDVALPPTAVGAVLAERLRIEQVLSDTPRYRIVLADDRERDELVLAVVAISEEELQAALTGSAAGQVLCRGRLGSCHLAEVAVDERHLQAFGDRLFACPSIGRGATRPREPGPPALRIGALFAARYRIAALLGRGGMGEVYRAYDEVLERTVALKIVRVEDAGVGGEELRRRLMKEARLVAGLKHSHIVEIYDAGEAKGLPFLVLELCEGGNLRRAIETKAASREDRLRWMREIAEALAFAHAHGVVHRDVKPENVVLTENGFAKLVDFGIAKALAPDVRAPALTLGIVGTPRYMAPEQLLVEAVDARADQFSWALVAYELWTDRPFPRGAAEIEGLRAAILSPESLDGLADILTKALSTERERRFETMVEVIARLDAMSATHRGLSWGLRRGAGGDASLPGVVREWAPMARGRRQGWLRPTAVVSGVVALTWGVTVAGIAKHDESASSIPAPIRETDLDGMKAPGDDPLVEAGLQLWVDGASSVAREQFRRASEKNPANARAHVLLAAASDEVDAPTAREHVRAAIGLRERLLPQDAAILEALESLLAEPPDARRATALMERAVERFANQRPLQLALAQQYLRVHQGARALTFADSIREDSPRVALWAGARARLQMGEAASGRSLLARCVEEIPDSTDCMEWLGRLDTNAGRCVEAEDTARKYISVHPESQVGYVLLASAIMGQTH